MRRLAAIESIELTLLASLGLAAACGGNPIGAPSGAVKSGPKCTSDAVSGAAGSAGTTSVTSDVDGGAGNGGMSGASSPQHCVNPVPIGADAGVDTGFDMCQGGVIERRAVMACPPFVPRTAPLGCVLPAQGGSSTCAADSDCGPKAYCTQMGAGSSAFCSCQSGCETDADCGSGFVCQCGSPMGRCVPATCTSDADCPGCYACISNPQSLGVVGYNCQTPRDTCFSNADCPNGGCALQWTCDYSSMGSGCGGHGAACMGRPFLVGHEERVAPWAPRCDWSDEGVLPDARGLSERQRTTLAEHWTRVGLMEHASIAAFARFTLHLLALGAPPSLVVASQEALAEETNHACLAFALASAYAGGAVGPGPLSIEGSLDGFDVASFLTTLVREGCIGETFAAIEARDARDAVLDPAVADVLETIARDELNHAALAWRTLAWLVASGRVARDDARTAVAEGVEHVLALAATRGGSATGGDPGSDLARFGVVSEQRRCALYHAACTGSVAHCADALLGSSAATTRIARSVRDPVRGCFNGRNVLGSTDAQTRHSHAYFSMDWRDAPARSVAMGLRQR